MTDQETLTQIAWHLDKLYSSGDAVTWLFTPQAALDDVMPAAMILSGQGQAVLDALGRLYNGDYV